MPNRRCSLIISLDRETLVAAAKKTGKVLLVTEDNKEGSVMSEIAAMISEDASLI